MRRAHPGWGPRTIGDELALQGWCRRRTGRRSTGRWCAMGWSTGRRADASRGRRRRDSRGSRRPDAAGSAARVGAAIRAGLPYGPASPRRDDRYRRGLAAAVGRRRGCTRRGGRLAVVLLLAVAVVPLAAAVVVWALGAAVRYSGRQSAPWSPPAGLSTARPDGDVSPTSAGHHETSAIRSSPSQDLGHERLPAGQEDLHRPR